MMLSENMDNFTFFFPIFVSSISFSLLIATASITSTMLNRGGAVGILVSVLVLKKNVQNFTIKHDVSYMFSID